MDQGTGDFLSLLITKVLISLRRNIFYLNILHFLVPALLTRHIRSAVARGVTVVSAVRGNGSLTVTA